MKWRRVLYSSAARAAFMVSFGNVLNVLIAFRLVNLDPEQYASLNVLVLSLIVLGAYLTLPHTNGHVP